jgi:hypothetical protein
MEPKFLSLLAFYNFKSMFSYNPFYKFPFSAWVHKGTASSLIILGLVIYSLLWN